MHQSPKFAGHEAQRAALGCAAILDPIKHPRRYALHKARLASRAKPCLEVNAVRRAPASLDNLEATRQRRAEEFRQERAKLADKARPLSHICLGEAAKEIGIRRDRMVALAAEFDLEFSIPTTATLELLRKLAGRGAMIAEIAQATRLSREDVMRLIDEHGIERGPKMNLEDR